MVVVLSDSTECCEFAGDGSSIRVGFLGMGIMGSPMAQNLIKAGYDIHHQRLIFQHICHIEKQNAAFC